MNTVRAWTYAVLKPGSSTIKCVIDPEPADILMGLVYCGKLYPSHNPARYVTKEEVIKHAIRLGLEGQSPLPEWKYIESEAPAPCQHQFVEMGFMHSKKVCKHCDLEQT